MTFEELQVRHGLDAKAIERFRVYARLLKEWNEKINLTSIVEEGEVIEKHFDDCLIALRSVPNDVISICDIGSGAGFPGLVFAIARPVAKLTLVDATGKKCRFLEEVSKELGLDNVRVLNLRAEDFKERETFDLVTARAVAPLQILLEITAPFAKVGGHILTLKGAKGEEELKASSKALKTLGLKLEKTDSLELEEGKRINLLFVKNEKTSPKYPRDWGSIQKKPL